MGIPLKHPFEVVLTGSATIHCRQGYLPILPASPWACLRPGVPRKKEPRHGASPKITQLKLQNVAWKCGLSVSFHACRPGQQTWALSCEAEKPNHE